MHRAALAAAGIAGDYVAREVDLEGFAAGVGELQEGRLDGANVTMPYKRAAFDVVDELADSAQRVGAVNTLVVRAKSLVGENTDVQGVLASFDQAGLPDSDPVVVLGAGGAAAAALVALGSRDKYIVARSPEKARRTADQVGVSATVIAWGKAIPAGVVVNATALGMRGEQLPEELMTAATGLLDMPYRDVPTPAVALLRKRGLPVADGLDMLVGQAVASFQIWTGLAVTAAVFRDAAEQEILKRARGASRSR
jgi:shikimate dehydrogenase